MAAKSSGALETPLRLRHSLAMPGKDRLKILHIVVAGQIGGAERFLADLATDPALTGADHLLALMTPNPALRGFFQKAGLRIHDRGRVAENPIATMWRSFGPRDLAWLGRVIAAEAPDILHAHTYGSHMLAARAGMAFARPVVRTEHGVRHYRDPSCGLYRHWALDHTDRIIAVSRFIGERIAALAPGMRDHIRVAPIGIDPARFSPYPPPASGPFTFAMLSRLETVKRVDLALRALALLPAVRLTVAGDGRERQRLERLSRRLGLTERVMFLGHLADPHILFETCDALLNATFEEGLGLAMIEAGAMARPALAVKSGGAAEVVVDGETGWLVEDDGPEALAAGMRLACADRDRAARFGQAARARMMRGFSRAAMGKAYAAVYREVCDIGRGNDGGGR